MLHLFETRRLNKHMSSYQMFKVTIETLAHSDWSVKGVAMPTDDENQSAPVCGIWPTGILPRMCSCDMGHSYPVRASKSILYDDIHFFI